MRDSGFNDRMGGMLYAYKIAKNDGIEGLEKEIKRRNITKIPFNYGKSELKHLWDDLCANMYNNITATFLYTLYDKYGFDKENITKLVDDYRENIACVLDVDYMGEHYVKLEDFAHEIGEKCGIQFDLNRIATCQDFYDEHNEDSNYHTVRLERLIKDLDENGYLAAAKYLRDKIE